MVSVRRCKSLRRRHKSGSRQSYGSEKLCPADQRPFRVRKIPFGRELKSWSGRPDLNRGPHAPQACALPGCATPRLLQKPREKGEKRVRRDCFKAITCVQEGSRKPATNPANPAASCDSRVASHHGLG